MYKHILLCAHVSMPRVMKVAPWLKNCIYNIDLLHTPQEYSLGESSIFPSLIIPE